MRNLKRALSLALASVMLLGMMVVGTSAASYPDVDDKDHVEAIEVLSAVGVIVGDNGNFRPDDKVSRNEMAVIMAKLILGTYEADSYVGSHPFTDVPDWASKYVAACYNSGIIAGRGEGIYDGSATVTAVEAAAMMLRALGYEDLSKNAKQWDQPVAAKANEISLFEGLSGASNAPMDRNSVAKLALNTLGATMVITEKGQDINIPGSVEIIGTRTYKDRTITPDGTKYSSIDGTTDGGKDILQLGEYLYKGDLVKGTAAPDDFGRPATTWTYDSKEIIVVADEADATYTKEVKAKDIYKDLGLSENKTATVKNNPGSDGTFSLTRTSEDKLTGSGNGVLVEAYKKAGGAVDIIVINTYVAKVDGNYNESKGELAVKEADSALALPSGVKYKLSSDDFAGLDSYKDGDYVLLTINDGEVKTIEKAEIISGDLASYRNDKMTVDGKAYSTTESYKNKYTGETGVDCDLVMDKYGYVIFAKAVESDDQYVYVTEYASKSGLGDTKYDATLYFVDGTKESAVVDEVTGDTWTADLTKQDANAWYTYEKNGDGSYDLTKVTGADKVKSGTTTSSNNSGKITETNEVNVQIASATVRTNNKTVFIVLKDKTATVYTGIREVPNITASDRTGAVVSAIVDNNVAEYVFVQGESTHMSVTGGGVADHFYILDAESTKTKDGDDTVYSYLVVQNGEITNVNMTKKTNALDGNNAWKVGLYKDPIETDGKGRIEKATLASGTSSDMRVYTIRGGVEIKGDVLEINGTGLAMADTYTIYDCDKDKTATINENDLNRDYKTGMNGEVAVVLDDDKVVEIYVLDDESRVPPVDGTDPLDPGTDIRDLDALRPGEIILGEAADINGMANVPNDVATGKNIVVAFETTSANQKVILKIDKSGVKYTEWATFTNAGVHYFYVNLAGRNGVGNAKADANDATVKANGSGKFGTDWIFTGSESAGWTPGSGAGTGTFTWTVSTVNADTGEAATQLATGSFTLS